MERRRRFGLGFPKEKASPISISDHDIQIKQNTQVATVTIVWEFFEVEDKNQTDEITCPMARPMSHHFLKEVVVVVVSKKPRRNFA